MDWNSLILLLLPLIILSASACVILMLDVFGGPEKDRQLVPAALSGLSGAGFFTVLIWAMEISTPVGSFVQMTTPAMWCGVLVIAAGITTVLMAEPSFVEGGNADSRGEYFALVTLGVAGMHLLTMATELITMFIAIEMIGLCLYVLAGYRLNDLMSQEAAFKYFLLAAFSSAFLLMGMAFIYGATGSTLLPDIAEVVASGQLVHAPWLSLGIILLFTGFAFKLTLAPFHMYAPDVYVGAPSPSASLIATGAKVAVFLALAEILRAIISPNFPLITESATIFIAAVALLSMFIGNFGAFVQQNVKRLLAYSSIAHAGYAALGYLALIAAQESGDVAAASNAMNALVYYLVGYTSMTILAFGVLTMLGEEGVLKRDLVGLAQRSPVLAAALAVSMVSLTGIPPTVGFFGKLLIFMSAINAGHVALALLGITLSILSAYYYLHIIVVMYFKSPEEADNPSTAPVLFEAFRPSAAALLIIGALLVAFAGPLFLQS